ncbi:MAG: flippase [Treponema sp.]|nr:flippase [Treponema sp.]
MAKSLKLNALFNVIRNILRLIFPLITFPYVSRVLMPEGIGKVNFANSIVMYFFIIASLGIGSYGIREAAKIRNDRLALTKFTKEMLTINMVSTLASYVLLAASLLLVRKFDSYRILIIVNSSSIILNTIGFEWLYSALEEYGYITLRSIIFQFVSLALTFILVRNSDDVVNYALVSVISNVGSNVCNLVHARKYLDLKAKVKLEIKKHLKPIFLLFFSSIAITVFSILDTSMVGFIKDDVEVGYYTSASKIVRMIRDLFPAISTVMFARVSYYVGRKEDDKIKEVSGQIFNLFYALTIPICLGFILLMKPILLVMCGQEFLPAVVVGQVLAPLVILSSISGYLSGALLISYGREKIYMYIEVGAALLDVVLNFILIPKYGALGAGIATLATEFVMFIVFHISVKDVISGVKIKKSLIQYIISSLIMALVVYMEIKFLPLSPILQILVGALSGALIYFVLLLIMKNEFLQNTLNNLKSKFGAGK